MQYLMKMIDMLRLKYAAAIEKEYAKYGREGGVYEPEGEFICTYEILEKYLEVVGKICEEYVEGQSVHTTIEPETDYSGVPLSMIDRVTMTDEYTHFDLSMPMYPLSCTIETTADIDVDYQRSYIVCAYTPTLEMVAATGFDDWIEYISHVTQIDQDKDRVTMDITCKVKQEISVGGVTSWSKIELEYTAVFDDVPC